MVSVAPEPAAEDELARAQRRFREYLTGERRASPHTVSAYSRDLESLVKLRARAGEGGPRHGEPISARQIHAACLAGRSQQGRGSADHRP